jgi:hypothetical protein
LLENVSIKDTKNGKAQIEPSPLVNTNDGKKIVGKKLNKKSIWIPPLTMKKASSYGNY